MSRDALLADGAGQRGASNRRGTDSAIPPAVYVVWLEDDPATVLRSGVRTGDLVWRAGAPHGGDRINRQVVVVGHDPATGQRVVRLDLGLGLVRDIQPISDELWLSVARRRLAIPCDRGVDVLAISASGVVRTVHNADSVDISRFSPALHRPPQDQIRDHIDAVRHRFDHLDVFWRSEDGATSPLSDGLSDPSVSVEGEWPDTRVVVTLRHRARPGLLLRRTLPLFDETGSPIDRTYADVDLMEDLDTGYPRTSRRSRRRGARHLTRPAHARKPKERSTATAPQDGSDSGRSVCVTVAGSLTGDADTCGCISYGAVAPE